MNTEAPSHTAHLEWIKMLFYEKHCHSRLHSSPVMRQLPRMGSVAEVLKGREVGITLQQLESWTPDFGSSGVACLGERSVCQTNKVAVVLLQGSYKITVKEVILASLKMCPRQSA